MPGRIRQDVPTASAQVARSRQRAGEGVTPTGLGNVPPVPPNQPTGRRTSRWRLSNWRLRWKLLIVLLVPLVTALSLGALRVANQLQSAGVYDKVSRQVALASSLDEVLDSLQREREQITLWVTSGHQAGSPPGGASTTASDAQVISFRQLAAKDDDLDASTQTAVTTALNAVNSLKSLRALATQSKFPEVDVLSGYNQILDGVLQSSQIVTTGSTDQRVSQLTSNLFDIRTAKQQYTLANAILMMTVTPVNAPDGARTAGWQFLPGTENQLNSAEAQFEASVTKFNDSASPADQQMFLDTFTGPDVDNRAQLLTLIRTRADQNLGAPPPSLLSVQPTTVQSAGDGAANKLEDAEEKLDSELKATTADLSTQAKDQAIRDGAILAGALLLAFLITLLVARSLVQSLRRLRSGALEVARTKLPQSVQRILADPDPIKASNRAVEPVPVFTADEIGEVARSFDVVHGQAVRLAAEQAVLRDNVNAIFINLSRRSQTLVERQLALIDRLEKDEQDPDQLANLFELDHLATRMRRNSESLLVLSGSGLAKRMSRPVPIGELVGAAVSEVEQYARIDVGAPPAASVLGRVVNDLIHLIAELLDNATSYSEPNTRVSVRIARTRSRELAIQITDRGVGMSEEDVRLANERLANPPDIDVGVTRRMGLYVVARLARRHNIRVKLRANEDIDGGTVALIVIPEDLVHRPGEDQGPVGSRDDLVADGFGDGFGVDGLIDSQAGMIDAFPAPAPAQPSSDLAGAASAAAGIAGAFGLASGRGRDEGGRGTNGSIRIPAQPDPADSGVVTSFWASDFEPSGSLEPADYADAGPVGANGANGSATLGSASLWEAHTAADAAPLDPADRSWQPDPVERPADGTTNGTAPRPDVDAPTERLPIYEAVLSQWFRADETQDVDEAQDVSETKPRTQPQPQQQPQAQPQPQSVPDENGLPTRVPGRAGAAAGFGLAKRLTGAANGASNGSANGHGNGRPAAAPTGLAAAASRTDSGVGEGWETPADEGWQRAEALLDPVSETTSAGLPKRVPKAHLVPGSAGPRLDPNGAGQAAGGGGGAGGTAQATLAPPALPPRSADAVRGRMSSFQQGLRRGRHTLLEAYSGEASHPSAHHADEEQE